MHYLHKILVNISEVEELSDSKPNTEEIRTFAELRTENYYNQAFDWRETDSAGRWSGEYPKQVYFAADDIDWFLKELNEVVSIQKREIDWTMAQLRATCGTDLDRIAESLWELNDVCDKRDGANDMTAYFLVKIAQILYGDYNAGSCFYNTNTYSARLYPSDIDKVIKAPENWALVMFDYHD